MFSVPAYNLSIFSAKDDFFLTSMFWWTRPLDTGCCPLWMLSLDITRSRWPKKTERKQRLSPYQVGGHVLLQGDAVVI